MECCFWFQLQRFVEWMHSSFKEEHGKTESEADDYGCEESVKVAVEGIVQPENQHEQGFKVQNDVGEYEGWRVNIASERNA